MKKKETIVIYECQTSTFLSLKNCRVENLVKSNAISKNLGGRNVYCDLSGKLRVSIIKTLIYVIYHSLYYDPISFRTFQGQIV